MATLVLTGFVIFLFLLFLLLGYSKVHAMEKMKILMCLSSEHLFSRTGATAIARKGNLIDDRVNMLTYIHDNMEVSLKPLKGS